MIRVLVADSSAVVRSVLKEIVLKTKKLIWVGESGSFGELQAEISKVKPDFVIAVKRLFDNEGTSVLANLYAPLNIPSIFFYEKGDKNVPTIKNIKFVEMPEFIKFSSQQMEKYALLLEQQVYDVKSAVLFENHLVANAAAATMINEDGSVTPPLKELSKSFVGRNYKAVLIGVSTGGPGTLAELLKGIGKNFPLPIFITQHIDSFFDKNLITWLGKETSVPVHLAENHKKPQAGHVYFAPSDEHLTFELNLEGGYSILLTQDPPVNFLRPAVDKMFDSAARVLGGSCIAVVLTGMGTDGAAGCLKLKSLGAYTITQNRETSVIYGMPKAAFENGGSCEELPLEQISERLWSLVGKNRV